MTDIFFKTQLRAGVKKISSYRRKIRLTLRYAVLAALAAGCDTSDDFTDKASLDRLAEQPQRPNILLIVLDDLGYSDLGAFGSEIQTPHMDKLAQEGMMFTNFHASPACSLTRAMLLTGAEAHQAGLGTMYEKIQNYQRGKSGYEGYLSNRVVTVATLLKDAGYHTYMAGKWHLGYEPDQDPAFRGFERSYVLLNAAGSHFDQSGYRADQPRSEYREDGQAVKLPEDFYSSDFYTDKLMQYIDQNLADDMPFFGYLAYTAPHWPLQAPAENIAKYAGKYDEGFDALYERRMSRMRELGLIPKYQKSSVYLAGNAGWQELNAGEKVRRIKEMEIYAAMIDRVDQNIGKLLAYLNSKDQLHNTFIFLLSDNGAMGNSLQGNRNYDPWLRQANNAYENMGLAGSYLYHHYGWAWVSNAPFKGIKLHVNEGGLRVPAIAWYPGKIKTEQRSDALLSVMDLAPTFLEVAATAHPGKTYPERNIAQLKGKSMWPLLSNLTQQIRAENETIAWETWGERAILNRDWKALVAPSPHGNGQWQLYSMRDDLSEAADLSQQNPAKLAQMVTLWEQYAGEAGVVLPQKSVR